ncbi:MAG TPA: hypothetical protein VF676_06925 [Flavobacterium sp.]|jgi:hypothetical protein
MKKSKVDIYKEGIRQQYKLAKEGSNSDYLLQPSPARLRDLCMILEEKGLSKGDETIFKKFFQFPEPVNWHVQLKKFDTGKLKPIQRFFLNNSELTAIEAINLAALLVDFNPRPFLQFKDKYEEDVTGSSPKAETDNITPEPSGKEDSGEELSTAFSAGSLQKNTRRRYIFAGTLLLILSTIMGLSFWRKPQCMVWNEVRYVEAACNEAGMTEIVPYDEKLFESMKKVYPSDTTTFFKNGAPILWYSKQGTDVEFFTYHGRHPLTGTPLKAVSRYIVQKYAGKH